jgi:hypothetical protein
MVWTFGPAELPFPRLWSQALFSPPQGLVTFEEQLGTQKLHCFTLNDDEVNEFSGLFGAVLICGWLIFLCWTFRTFETMATPS